MLFRNTVFPTELSVAPAKAAICNADTGKIVLGGGFRLPVHTVDNGIIGLGSRLHLPVCGADHTILAEMTA